MSSRRIASLRRTTLTALASAIVTTCAATSSAQDTTAPMPTLTPAPALMPTPTLTPAPLPEPPFNATAGYRNGTFFLRDPSDVFRLYIQGRVHADWLDQIGPGVSSLPAGSGVEHGFFLRRARIELAGEFFETWQWWVGAEFSSATSIDNAAANQATPTCSVAANSALSCVTAKENPVENPTVKAIPTDVFVNFGPSPWTNLQVGQFYLPFSLENRISDNTMPFLERSLAVRTLAAPLQRDIGAMFWGESPDRLGPARGIRRSSGTTCRR